MTIQILLNSNIQLMNSENPDALKKTLSVYQMYK